MIGLVKPPPHQIGLVKLQPSCHNHERYKHWQKRLNQYRHKVLSWCLHRLGPIKKISPVPLWTGGPCVGQKLHNLPLTPCFGFRLSVHTKIQCRASWIIGMILWLSNTRGPWSCTAPLRVTFPCRLVLLGRFFFLSDTRTASIKSLLSFRESAFHRAMRIKFLC